jgi:drug/metabolite transporter (DMT)-like permease
MYRCIPDISRYNYTYVDESGNATAINTAINYAKKSSSLGTEIFSDVYNSWLTILICTLIALAFSFLWLVAIQHFAGFIVWVTLLLVNGLGIGLTAYMWSLYLDNKATNDANVAAQGATDTMSYNQQMLLALSIIATVVSVGIFLLTVALRGRIRLAIALIEETAK